MMRPPEYGEYARSAGFLLISDVGHLLFERARLLTHDLEPVEVMDARVYLNPSAGGLAATATYLSHKMGDFVKSEDPQFDEQYGVTEADRAFENNQFRAASGLGDLHFTWHFAPGVANAVAESFERHGHITGEQRAQLTLGDWSYMLRSRWFSDLVHDLAFTANGIYRNFGEHVSHYGEGTLAAYLEQGRLGFDGELFDTSLQYDPETDTTHLAVTLTREFRSLLRAKMHEQHSLGCPAARGRARCPWSWWIARTRSVLLTPEG